MKPSTVLFGLSAINFVFPKKVPAKYAQMSFAITTHIGCTNLGCCFVSNVYLHAQVSKLRVVILT